MIRNIVFDIGNVLVTWDSLAIVQAAFGLEGDTAAERRRALFVTTDIWLALNRGEMSVEDTKRAYMAEGLMDADEAERFFVAVYDSFAPIAGTEALMRRLKDAGFRLFALTDNVHEIVAHLKDTHRFWPLFEGATVSAEVGLLKPDPLIYRHLLDSHDLEAEETVFFDDIPRNVEGARDAGIQAFLFTTAEQAEADLASLGIAV
ncbi:HAD family hydrolase [Qipengyuania sp.]|uniref:HAD family hydrolase n=1 Tax=Qipengyuania sp. TaxID=2004515 RepID=UPI0035C7EA25